MTVALTFLGGIATGAFIAVLSHRFTSRRDQANRRSEMRIRFLLDAYRSLADVSNRGVEAGTADARRFEQAIEDIQLLGSGGQAERARELAAAMASTGGASTDDLLAMLRDDLRGELGLSALPQPPVHLRVVDRRS